MARSALVIMGSGLSHLLGTDGREWYNFWSGFGADLGQVAVLGAAIGIYRKHNCHVHRCWRIAKQQVIGTSWVVCHKHHPEGHPTAQQVAEVHSKVRRAEHAALERAVASHDVPTEPTRGSDAQS